jgi:hypothetical protein
MRRLRLLLRGQPLLLLELVESLKEHLHTAAA